MAAKTAAEPKSPSNSETQNALSLQVSLPQMLDLALGAPEIGAVNLNILHNFLHVVLHQINLRTTKVEFRGDEANRLRTVISSSKAGPSVKLHEYSITDPSGKIIHRTHSSESRINADVFTDNFDGRITDNKEGKGRKSVTSAPVTARGKSRTEGSEESLGDGRSVSGAKKTKGSRHQIGSGIEGERHSVIFVEPILDGVAPTALSFKRLEESVKKLHDKFHSLDDLAKNSEIIDRVKSSKGDPLSDMWHMINVTKRLDAAEEGIEKLTTIVQDFIKSNRKLSNGEGEGFEELRNLNDALLETEDRSSQIALYLEEEQGATNGTAKEDEKDVAKNYVDDQVSPSDSTVKRRTLSSTRRSVIGGVDLTDLKEDVSVLKNEMNIVRRDFEELRAKLLVNDDGEPILGSDGATNIRGVTDAAEKLSGIELTKADEVVTNAAKEAGSDGTRIVNKKSASKSSVTSGSRVVEIDRSASSSRFDTPEFDDEKMGRDIKTIRDVEANVENGVRDVKTRLDLLEKEIVCVNEKIKSESLSALGIEGIGGIGDLVEIILGIRTNMEKINDTTSKLVDYKENQDLNTTAMIEQIELLKTIKADKEDLEDALADKADAQTVNRKVSHDQLDAACDDLARGLDDAITKLSQQESVWQQALDEVQREIEGKVDKIEISPLKDFVNNRLKLLQEKLKALGDMRRENEAAGTKKMLRDVQCISCDSNVVMRMEENVRYRAPRLPGTRSMKPYLTYELDQVRRQQRRLPHSRNMIDFEVAMQEMSRNPKPEREELLSTSPRDHLCNRYCGGSHTITTPQQRVMRMGHFLAQWGPEVIQLTEGVVRGNDGHLYRSRAMPGKQKVPESPAVGENVDIPPSTPSSPSVPVNVSSVQRQSQSNNRRSNSLQSPKRLSARKSSVAHSKDAVDETKVEELPMVPATPPSGPPGTIVDEGDTIPEPAGPADEVVGESPFETDDISVELKGVQEFEGHTV